jgi:hypothetical protein
VYFVPIAGGVLLVSLGSDYNVFVVGRIWEEARHRPVRDAVRIAAPRASGAITTAGLALAASFAMLALIPLEQFRQLALLMAIGVILDAVVVRSVLVPSLVVLFGRVGMWPSSQRVLSGRLLAGGLARLADADGPLADRVEDRLYPWPGLLRPRLDDRAAVQRRVDDSDAVAVRHPDALLDDVLADPGHLQPDRVFRAIRAPHHRNHVLPHEPQQFLGFLKHGEDDPGALRDLGRGRGHVRTVIGQRLRLGAVHIPDSQRDSRLRHGPGHGKPRRAARAENRHRIPRHCLRHEISVTQRGCRYTWPGMRLCG